MLRIEKTGGRQVVEQIEDPQSKGSSDAASGASRRAVAAQAAVFASGTMLSRVLGLIRDRMTAQYFGPEVRDAFIVAYRLPNLFRRVLGEGALSVSLVPVLVSLLTPNQGKKGTVEFESARRLVGAIFTLLLSITLTLTFLAVVWMPELLAALLPGDEYRSVAGKFELTVKLARLMFGFLIVITLYAFFMAILNSLKRFALSALAPALFNVAMIGAALVSKDFAAPENVLAISVLVGGLLQMGILVPQVIGAGLFPRFSFMWRVENRWAPIWKIPEVQRVFRAMGPGLLGLSVLQLSSLVSAYFASYLSQGSHFYLYCADRVNELPLSLFAVSMGIAVLPTLSGQFASGAKAEMASTLNHALRLMLFVALPAAIGMFFLAQPITEVLFLGREFRLRDAVQTAEVIQIYSVGLVATAGVRILVQGFYAMGNTWYPALAGVIALIVQIILSWAGTKAFGLKGLAAAGVFAGLTNLMLLAVAFGRWVAPLNWARLILSILRFLPASVALALATTAYNPLIDWMGSRTLTRAIALSTVIAIATLIYFSLSALFRIEESRETTGRLLGKLKSKIVRSQS